MTYVTKMTRSQSQWGQQWNHPLSTHCGCFLIFLRWPEHVLDSDLRRGNCWLPLLRVSRDVVENVSRYLCSVWTFQVRGSALKGELSRVCPRVGHVLQGVVQLLTLHRADVVLQWTHWTVGKAEEPGAPAFFLYTWDRTFHIMCFWSGSSVVMAMWGLCVPTGSAHLPIGPLKSHSVSWGDLGSSVKQAGDFDIRYTVHRKSPPTLLTTER